MNITFKEHFQIELYGKSGIAQDQNWPETGMDLMGRMWKEVQALHLPNNGINVWVYEEGARMFAGVALSAPPPAASTLEFKQIRLPEYVYFKHIGPYDKIKESFASVQEELKKTGKRTGLPYLEIYGHWTEDTSRLETEMLWSVLH